MPCNVFFIGEYWTKSKLAITETGKQIYEHVLSQRFWNSVQDCIKASYPLLLVLWIVDNDERPVMPKFDATMDYA